MESEAPGNRRGPTSDIGHRGGGHRAIGSQHVWMSTVTTILAYFKFAGMYVCPDCMELCASANEFLDKHRNASSFSGTTKKATYESEYPYIYYPSKNLYQSPNQFT